MTATETQPELDWPELTDAEREVSRRLADVTAERDRLREGIMRPKPDPFTA